LLTAKQQNTYGISIAKAVHSAACTALWSQASRIGRQSAVFADKGSTFQMSVLGSASILSSAFLE
jgi:hypothetical protein